MRKAINFLLRNIFDFDTNIIDHSFSEPAKLTPQAVESSDKEARGESGATDQIREQAIE